MLIIKKKKKNSCHRSTKNSLPDDVSGNVRTAHMLDYSPFSKTRIVHMLDCPPCISLETICSAVLYLKRESIDAVKEQSIYKLHNY